jgi:hypothetical protein
MRIIYRRDLTIELHPRTDGHGLHAVTVTHKPSGTTATVGGRIASEAPAKERAILILLEKLRPTFA